MITDNDWAKAKRAQWEVLRQRLVSRQLIAPTTNEDLWAELAAPVWLERQPWTRGTRFFSSAWTGRSANAGSPAEMFRRWLRGWGAR